jgi:serine/threonine-protein kinase
MTADPTSIGRYRIESILGRGAMGVVYRAHDPEIDRPVAIKLIRADLMDGEDRTNYIARFRREAQAAARCNHPNVVTIYDFAMHAENPFLAMEFVDGVSLRQAHGHASPLPPAQAGFLILQVLDALAAAHAMGVVHRDIKPANILLVANNRVKVTDFGISRFTNSEMTQTGDVVGTPSYMSPEQCRGDTVDARSDLFSTGTILFELLCGTRPFPGRNVTEVMQRVLQDSPADIASLGITLPIALQEVLDRALAKSPEARFATAIEMSAALRAAIAADLPAAASALQERTLVLPRTQPVAATQTTATASLASLGFDRDVLATLERKLAHYVGPIARVLVQKAVRDAPDVDALHTALAASIERPQDREAFRREFAGQTASVSPSAPPQSVSPTALIDDAARSLAQRELARFIGPVAALLVRREAALATCVSDLWQRLSLHLENSADRRAFLALRKP